MKKIISIVIGVIILSCGIIQQSDHTEEMAVLQKHFSNLDKGEKLNRHTINKISLPSNRSLKDLINFATLNDNIVANGHPDAIKFDTIFDSSEMTYIREKFSTAEPVRLKKSWFPNIDLTTKTKNTSGEIKFSTLPVLSPDGRFALLYTEDYFGGQIYVYKKNISSGEWEFFSTSSIWMS
jgi:hypothetical protein